MTGLARRRLLLIAGGAAITAVASMQARPKAVQIPIIDAHTHIVRSLGQPEAAAAAVGVLVPAARA